MVSKHNILWVLHEVMEAYVPYAYILIVESPYFTWNDQFDKMS